jgi:hypothetical protein
MSVDHIRYDVLTQEAMRGVVRTVLKDAAAKGLPGEHHFFITFDTRSPGVKLSPRMRAQYPEDMTIVLQHQFWDLAVNGDDALEVGLSFGGIPERLAVPLVAIKSFVDPSVKFGMQFAEAAEDAAEADAEVTQGEKPVQKPAEISAIASAKDKPDTKTDPAADAEKPTAEVVRFDRFRKK